MKKETCKILRTIGIVYMIVLFLLFVVFSFGFTGHYTLIGLIAIEIPGIILIIIGILGEIFSKKDEIKLRKK